MGNNVKYVVQSGVTKNSKNGQTLMGFPAVEKDKFIKSFGDNKKITINRRKLNKIEEILYNLHSMRNFQRTIKIQVNFQV